MSGLALALVLIAALLHTGWNLLLKHLHEKLIVTWWALLVGALASAPLIFVGGAIDRAAWPYVIASAIAETAYFIALIRAYQQADFSLVYPLARGVAPALLTLWAIAFLGERPQAWGVVGLALLLGGVIVVGGGSVWARRRAAVSAAGVVAALTVALCISIYSAIDGAAVRLVWPPAYTALITTATTLCVAPLLLVRFGAHAALRVWRADWRRIIAIGIMMLLAYMLVLQAYALAQVSYVGALREISIVFAALVGWRWLREPLGGWRTSGALLMFSGLLTIAIAG